MDLICSNSTRSRDSYVGLLARLCLVVTILLAAGCATTREGQPKSQDAGGKENCTRLEAAVRAYHEAINPNKMLQKAMQDCKAGDPYACGAIPGIWPMAALTEVFGAPLLIPILATSPNIQQRACPQKPSTTEAGATASDSESIVDPGE